MINVDIIIIGSGMAGLYSAYQIKKFSPSTSFLILEKNKKKWIGGRAGSETFYGSEIETGAGIGRKKKDKLLLKLVNQFQLTSQEFNINPKVINKIKKIDINEVMNYLKSNYKNIKNIKNIKNNKNIFNISGSSFGRDKNKNFNFKHFAINIIGEEEYKNFILNTGYTDYENADVYETLYNYGMEDNTCCWKAFSVPWRELVLKLYHHIGIEHFKFSNNVIDIQKKSHQFIINTENKKQYLCNKVIIASTIDTIKKLLPNHPIYNNIAGQPFSRIYAKLDKKSIPIMKEYIKETVILTGPLQKIISINPDNGIYMIAYNDNDNAIALKNYLKNIKSNREFYERLLENSLGISENSLGIIAIKSFYWNIGTHYYKPLKDSLDKIQTPEKGILVVGEAVSHKQGWVEGALESVKSVVTKKWIKN
jgi:thioredoxin reductase